MTGKGRPEPGDLTLCIGCGALLKFTDKLTVELIDEDKELAAMTTEQRRRIIMAKFAINMTRDMQPKETKH